MGLLIGGLNLIVRGGVGVGGGAGEPIAASLGAQAFLRRRDTVSDTEGVFGLFWGRSCG